MFAVPPGTTATEIETMNDIAATYDRHAASPLLFVIDMKDEPTGRLPVDAHA